MWIPGATTIWSRQVAILTILRSSSLESHANIVLHPPPLLLLLALPFLPFLPSRPHPLPSPLWLLRRRPPPVSVLLMIWNLTRMSKHGLNLSHPLVLLLRFLLPLLQCPCQLYFRLFRLFFHHSCWAPHPLPPFLSSDIGKKCSLISISSVAIIFRILTAMMTIYPSSILIHSMMPLFVFLLRFLSCFCRHVFFLLKSLSQCYLRNHHGVAFVLALLILLWFALLPRPSICSMTMTV